MVGVLLAVGGLAFRAGQAQGYALGVTVSNGDLPQVPAGVLGFYPAYGMGMWPHFGFMPFWSLLCLFGLGVAFLFALGMIFRPRHWHGYGRGSQPGDPQADDWHAAWHGWHGSPPPGPWMNKKETPSAPPYPTQPAEDAGQS